MNNIEKFIQGCRAICAAQGNEKGYPVCGWLSLRPKVYEDTYIIIACDTKSQMMEITRKARSDSKDHLRVSNPVIMVDERG
jgi:hypothetical protein